MSTTTCPIVLSDMGLLYVVCGLAVAALLVGGVLLARRIFFGFTEDGDSWDRPW